MESGTKLNKYAKNYTSQYGEDGIIEYLLNTSKIPINKSCFEVGAGDGITFSNTHILWQQNLWDAILVEANPERSKTLKKTGGTCKTSRLLQTSLQ